MDPGWRSLSSYPALGSSFIDVRVGDLPRRQRGHLRPSARPLAENLEPSAGSVRRPRHPARVRGTIAPDERGDAAGDLGVGRAGGPRRERGHDRCDAPRASACSGGAGTSPTAIGLRASSACSRRDSHRCSGSSSSSRSPSTTDHGRCGSRGINGRSAVRDLAVDAAGRPPRACGRARVLRAIGGRYRMAGDGGRHRLRDDQPMGPLDVPYAPTDPAGDPQRTERLRFLARSDERPGRGTA